MPRPEPRGGNETAQQNRRQSSKNATPQDVKRRNAPKILQRGISLATGEETNVGQLTRELAEAREREAATSEVLKVISSSPGELEPVFNAMLENATRICEAKFGTLYRYDGGAFHPVTFHKVPSSLADFLRQRGSFVSPAGAPFDRLLRTRNVIHVVDDDSAEPVHGAAATLDGARVRLAVPMLKDNELVGAILIYRKEMRPFTDKQIELVKNFAAQAVIAIENTRLLNELRQSLEQQTATSEVLQVISSSAGELKPVFETMLESAVRICGASFGTLLLFEGNAFRRVAAHNAPHEYVQFADGEPFIRLDRARSLDRLTKTKEPVQIADMAEAEPNSPLTKLGRARTYFAVPMLKEDELIGAIGIYRQEVRPVHRQTDRASEELRRPGGHRHREHAAAQRAAQANRRSFRGA